MTEQKDVDSNLIKKKAIKSIKWSVLAETLKAFPSLVTLILTRILVPEDFGIMAIAMIFIGLAQVFQDFGLGKALIQREGEIKKAANVVFWSNIFLGIFLYGIILATAPLIAEFFHEAETVRVLRVVCLQIIFIAFSGVHLALLQRDFQFRKIFFSQLIVSLVPGIISLPLALMGWGVWALVWGFLTASFAQILILWRVNKWRPQIEFDRGVAKELFTFGSWVLIELLFAWLIVQGDSIALGHFLNIKELGIYRVGASLVMLIFGTVFNPLLPILYSSFSRLQSQFFELRQSFLKVVRLAGFLSLPLGVGLVLIARPISSVFFKQDWMGIETVILLIGITQTISWLIGINHGVFRAIGRPDANSKLLGIFVVISLPVYILAAPHGLLTFCLARLALEIVFSFLHFFAVNKLLNLNFFYLWQCAKRALLSALVMGLIVYGIISLIAPFENWQGLFKIILIVIIGGLSYLSALYFLDRLFFRRSKELLIEALRGW